MLAAAAPTSPRQRLGLSVERLSSFEPQWKQGLPFEEQCVFLENRCCKFPFFDGVVPKLPRYFMELIWVGMNWMSSPSHGFNDSSRFSYSFNFSETANFVKSFCSCSPLHASCNLTNNKSRSLIFDDKLPNWPCRLLNLMRSMSSACILRSSLREFRSSSNLQKKIWDCNIFRSCAL